MIFPFDINRIYINNQYLSKLTHKNKMPYITQLAINIIDAYILLTHIPHRNILCT